MPERLKVMFADHLGLHRAKHLPLAGAGDEAVDGAGSVRFCRSVFGFTMGRKFVNSPGSQLYQGMPDMDAKWDAGAVRASWHEGERMVIADLFDKSGAPLPLCGRGALRRALAQWEELGQALQMGIELEAYALVKDADGGLQPLSAPGAFCYQTGVFCDPAGFTDAIWEAAHRAQLPLQTITTECDESQYELVLRHTDPLTAVDDAFAFRLLAREVAWRYGVVLTFLPKPVAGRGGSGVHYNFSFRDTGRQSAGNPLLAAAGSRSQLASGCIAGLLTHHRALSGLLAPTVNSYSRLMPANFSGYWANWGVDHRGTTVRLSEGFTQQARIEHRLADGGSNMYTAAAAILQAARLGYSRGDEPQPAETGDCFEQVDASVHTPESLPAALDQLEADDELTQAVGSELVANHVAMKRAEAQEVAAQPGDNPVLDYYVHFV